MCDEGRSSRLGGVHRKVAMWLSGSTQRGCSLHIEGEGKTQGASLGFWVPFACWSG